VPGILSIIAITWPAPGSVWIDVEEVLRATPAKSAALSLLDGELLED